MVISEEDRSLFIEAMNSLFEYSILNFSAIRVAAEQNIDTIPREEWKVDFGFWNRIFDYTHSAMRKKIEEDRDLTLHRRENIDNGIYEAPDGFSIESYYYQSLMQGEDLTIHTVIDKKTGRLATLVKPGRDRWLPEIILAEVQANQGKIDISVEVNEQVINEIEKLY